MATLARVNVSEPLIFAVIDFYTIWSSYRVWSPKRGVYRVLEPKSGVYRVRGYIGWGYIGFGAKIGGGGVYRVGGYIGFENPK